ncbi:ankyrin repeat domain-containing protein 37 isoform X1 [Oncorhynchus mykiss]|uniref:Ankyrin repeat domain 37 n=1 Tax=Oncorhynchus mykiss TaxID=8022 RepID=A0A060WAN7_ONCMY|nr:ankyrin repeat domain-containing protein 37 isoform X1 [Oncorhynchus mykiss]CDQ64207.1 unnamed protein product [Oncorhynchus mykiss]
MFLLDSDSQLDCISNLFEGGDAVNSSNVLGQSPAHLAACSGQAFCLLWLLQTGADANQQDNNGETPMHKAAKAGSLECISVLVASDAQLGLCNNEGRTAEELALSYGFEECGRFLNTLRMTRLLTSSSTPLMPAELVACPLTDAQSGKVAGQKRALIATGAQDRKRARDW